MRFAVCSESGTAARHGERGIIVRFEQWLPEGNYGDDSKDGDANDQKIACPARKSITASFMKSDQ